MIVLLIEGRSARSRDDIRVYHDKTYALSASAMIWYILQISLSQVLGPRKLTSH
jgi:hypothetical protein